MRVTDALGNQTNYAYDGVGRRISVTDPRGNLTAFGYDGNGNLLSINDALGGLSQNVYDATGNRKVFIDPRGKDTAYAYDAKDLLTTTTDALGGVETNSYDALDRKISTRDKNGNTTNYVYDAVGNLLQITDPLGKITAFTYDANGNQLTIRDPNNNVSSTIYDKLNRVISTTDALGNTTLTGYDAVGRVISSTNAKSQMTSFVFDARGRLLQVNDANGGTVVYTYDANGNRLSATDPNGKTTTFAYDALNRVLTKTEPLGNLTSYIYDAVGNRTRVSKPNGSIINYTYDPLNRLSSIAYPDTSGVTFSYDANGNRIQMVDGLGTSTYQYDGLNRITSYTNGFSKTVGYGYDNNGNRTTLTYPDGKTAQYTFDALNRLVSVTDWQNRTSTYSYDNGGRVTNSANPNGTGVSYSYDNANRLVALTNAKSDSTVIASYNFTLDQIGNQTQAAANEPLVPNLAAQVVGYTYDNENRLIDAGGVANTFDADGNMTAKGPSTFLYDFEDRLVQSTIGGITTQYRYDGVGNRHARIEGGITKRFVLDISGKLSNVLSETDVSGNITVYYVYGLGLISRVLPNGNANYYHYDSRGSAVALTDDAQAITDSYAYDPFGKLANSSGSTQNPFKYVGRYGVMDEGNSIAYIRARYYESNLGRFVSKDSLAGSHRNGQSLNRYVYALNSPAVLIDISGMSAQEGQFSINLSTASDMYHFFLVDGRAWNTAGSTPQTVPSTNTAARYFNAAVKVGANEVAERVATYAWIKFAGQIAYHTTTDPNRIGSVFGKTAAWGIPIIGAGISGVSEIQKNKNANMDWTEKASRASFKIGLSAGTSLLTFVPGVGPYLSPIAATFIEAESDSAYENIIEPLGVKYNNLSEKLSGTLDAGLNWVGEKVYQIFD